MERPFDKIMSSKSTEELIKIIQFEQDNYQSAAVDAAKRVLNKRNISLQEIELITQNISAKEVEETRINNNSISVGIRFVNYFIDSLIWLIIVFIITSPLNAHNPLHKAIGYVIAFLTYILYYIILEIKFQKTLGKLITRTKVVTYNEEIPTSKDIIIRTILRFIPFDNVSFLFTRHGFHDMLSETKVIKEKNTK